MKIGFVILCYGQFEIVCECVDKVKKLHGYEGSELILVDNCSPDKTGKRLKEKYSSEKNITVILNEDNVGFARGNNIGYSYATKEKSCDCIVTMNSDVSIDDVHFLDKLKKIVSENENVDVFAPDVLDDEEEGVHWNPYALKPFTKKEAMDYYLKNCIINLLGHLKIDIIKIRTKQKERKEGPAKIHADYKFSERQYGTVPIGCCIIFSPKWCKRESKAFYEKTFLYCEEFFLTAYILKMNYLICYEPNLVVSHSGGASTVEYNSNRLKKEMLARKRSNKSLLEYVKVIDEIEKHW